jgi:integrase
LPSRFVSLQVQFQSIRIARFRSVGTVSVRKASSSAASARSALTCTGLDDDSPKTQIARAAIKPRQEKSMAEGSIVKRGNSYAVVFDIKSDDGRRKRKWVSVRGGRRDAERKRRELLGQVDKGEYVEPTKETVSQFLDRWLDHIQPNVSAKTHETYARHAKTLGKLIGGKTLTTLQPRDISAAYAEAVKTLAPRMVNHLHRVLFQALGQAERWRVINRNPCSLLERGDRPRIEKKPVAVIDAATTAKTLDAARDTRLFVPILLAALLGLRRGEVCALRWKSVDLDAGQLSVVASTEQLDTGATRDKSTKSGKSRTIALPQMAIAELSRWRAQQAAEFARLGLTVDGETKVFTREDSRTIKPRSLTVVIRHFMKSQGLKIRLHGLRHSHASQMLAENVHPKVVQERLGHAGVALTLDVYSHCMPNMQSEAALAIDSAFRKAAGSKW